MLDCLWVWKVLHDRSWLGERWWFLTSYGEGYVKIEKGNFFQGSLHPFSRPWLRYFLFWTKNYNFCIMKIFIFPSKTMEENICLLPLFNQVGPKQSPHFHNGKRTLIHTPLQIQSEFQNGHFKVCLQQCSTSAKFQIIKEETKLKRIICEKPLGQPGY